MGPNDDKLMINQLTLTNEHDHILNIIQDIEFHQYLC